MGIIFTGNRVSIMIPFRGAVSPRTGPWAIVVALRKIGVILSTRLWCKYASM